MTVEPPLAEAPLVGLVALLEGQAALLSIDTDIFVDQGELQLAAALEVQVARLVAAGVPVTYRQDHVDLVHLVDRRFDVVLNFDRHMDLSLEFLAGAAPHHPPHDATVFETILSSGHAQHYIWAYPTSRGPDAAWVFAWAVRSDRQPLVRRIHCLLATEATVLLDQLRVEWVFVCRSPEYATADSEAVFERLRRIATDSGLAEAT